MTTQKLSPIEQAALKLVQSINDDVNKGGLGGPGEWSDPVWTKRVEDDFHALEDAFEREATPPSAESFRDRFVTDIERCVELIRRGVEPFEILRLQREEGSKGISTIFRHTISLDGESREIVVSGMYRDRVSFPPYHIAETVPLKDWRSRVGVCGDIAAGRTIVVCECGGIRELDRPHGYKKS